MFRSDISEAFPNGEVSSYFRNDWLTQMCRETRANKDFSPRTQETARWAREQIKRQAGKNARTVLSVSCWPENDHALQSGLSNSAELMRDVNSRVAREAELRHAIPAGF